MSEASGTGGFFLEYHPGPNGISFLACSGELRGASEAAEEGMRRMRWRELCHGEMAGHGLSNKSDADLCG